MDQLQLDIPSNWIGGGYATTPGIIQELKRRHTPQEWKESFEPILGPSNDLHPLSPRLWVDEIQYIQFVRREIDPPPESLDILGRILCQALGIPRDCHRTLGRGEKHNLLFFTNFRAIQVYCCHNPSDKRILEDLLEKDFQFRFFNAQGIPKTETYHQCTDFAFDKARKCIAWECIFPEGIDMEALSPRDINAHLRVKPSAPKTKAPAAKLSNKEKDHPPPPPEEVREPPSSDRRNGAIYRTGRLLGKGGFAICYEGQLAGTKQKYALKIVKSHMPQKKMEQKFQTELQIHSKMKHANIVQFHRAFSYEKCTYIVLELCPNGSLMDMVKKRRYITEPEVRFWTVQIAGAIKYMHEKGIIHRDLKMGNIFLDKDMNVKVGDFGLAALLMSGKDWQACRRTTLCGTPNYIAPEILSKDKGGHDHAVDIWSLGIIIFAMLTGKPPFQSATADEIYRRAKDRDYDWPKLDTSENFISQETKNLVSILLQEAEKRPDPDTIVQHPFFTCGWMPQSEEMTPSLRDHHPEPNQFLSVGVRGGRTNLYLRNLKKLCEQCEVGPWLRNPRSHKSTYRECEQEEKAGLTPIVPLREDVVYRPFHEWLREQADISQRTVMETTATDDKLEDVLRPVPASRSTNLPLPSSSRPPTQSFAAQQRARPQAPAPSRIVTARKPSQESRATASTFGKGLKASAPKVETGISEDVADVENRLAADLVHQLNAAEAERRSQESDARTISLQAPASLFGPREKVEALRDTKPDSILESLRHLHTELERALNSRTTAIQTRAAPPSPPIVVKWVDYTNKYGLGYILSNGSVGCIFRTTPADDQDPEQGYIPPCCVVVRNAEYHLQNKSNETYIDRHQIVPVSGSHIEFYENRGDNGMYCARVNPKNFRVTVNEKGEHIRSLPPGVDKWDNRKRSKIILWKKFANYMTQYGRDTDFPYDEALTRKPDEIVAAGNAITFYQRFGDVGIWGFCDGHFQFNFPDHTKVIISADGTWCDFYHLPLEAARDLSLKGEIPASALDDRQKLSYPLQTLLNFMSKPSRSRAPSRKRPEIDPMLQGIPQANDFRRKVEFIRTIVKEWIKNGGIGNSDTSPEGRLKWEGQREVVNVATPYKHVWTTVGARAGDVRLVAWFDPRKPNATLQDIEC